jgi:hypothetical protein
MDELILDSKKYLSSKHAAKVTGYAKDYVGQLCREGRVDARLVGRNWYVLESSILEHRFGAEEKPDEAMESHESGVEKTWEAPKYVPEEVKTIPEIAPKPAIVGPSSEAVLADMQSAWKEWFEKQEKAQVDIEPVAEDLPELEVEPVRVQRIVPEPPQEAAEAPEEEIPVRIERIAPEPPREEDLEPLVTVVRHIQPQTVNVSHSRHQRAPLRKNRHGFAARALFIALAGISVAIAIIGSGLADNFILHSGGVSPVTNFFGGVNTINAK